MYVVCKYYTILYKGLEHPWILVFAGVTETNPLLTKKRPYLKRMQVWLDWV